MINQLEKEIRLILVDLLTRIRKVFNWFLRHFFFQRRLSTEEFAQVTLRLRNLWSVYKICKRDKSFSSFSFSLCYTFQWLLIQTYLQPGRTSTMSFFVEILNFFGSLKIVLREISQNSKESIQVGISFFDKVKLCRTAV